MKLFFLLLLPVLLVCGPFPIFSPSVFTSEIALVEWIAPDNTVAYVIAGRLYRSTDTGKTFQPVNLPDEPPIRSKSNSSLPSNVARYFRQTSDPNKHYVVGRNNMWCTSDKGVTFTRMLKNYIVVDVNPHPFDPEWVLILTFNDTCRRTSSSCHLQLYFSPNMGKNVTLLNNFVRPAGYSWGHAGVGGVPKENIHMLAIPTEKQTPNSHQWELDNTAYSYLHSTDFFKTVKVRKDKCAGMAVTPEFVFLNMFSDKDGGSNSLLVSEDDGNSFLTALFPSEISASRFTLLDTREGAAFVNIESTARFWGHTFVSDSFTGTSFAYSLKYTARSGRRVDFAAVEGVEGFYIANAYQTSNPLGPSSTSPVQTMISYDNGGVWQRIKAPSSNCRLSQDCGLNLFGPSSAYSSFLLSKFATGMIVATGHEGSELTHVTHDQVSTYLSRDAGVTWEKVSNGTHHYRFADQGSLIGIVPDYVSTNTFKYSVDQGQTWTELNLPLQAFMAEDIIGPAVPHAKFMVVQGETLNESGVLVHIDFSQLDMPVCTDSDFEMWSPLNTLGCVLGRHISYKRRKKTSKCFHDSDFTPVISSTPCSCAAEDYECDYCFVREGNQCIRTYEGNCQDYNHLAAPPNCVNTFNATRGYRLVAKTKCDPLGAGAVNWLPVATPCSASPTDKPTVKPTVKPTDKPTSKPGGQNTTEAPTEEPKKNTAMIAAVVILTIAVVVAFIIGIGVYLVKTNDRFRGYWERITGKKDNTWASASHDDHDGHSARGLLNQGLDDDDDNDTIARFSSRRRDEYLD